MLQIVTCDICDITWLMKNKSILMMQKFGRLIVGIQHVENALSHHPLPFIDLQNLHLSLLFQFSFSFVISTDDNFESLTELNSLVGYSS